MEEKIIKKPPAAEETLPILGREEDDPRPTDVGRVFKEIFRPPEKKGEE